MLRFKLKDKVKGKVNAKVKVENKLILMLKSNLNFIVMVNVKLR